MAIYNNETDQNVIDSEKKCYTIYATIRIEIETDLHITDAIDEFQNDCLYNFPDTEKCKVLNTCWEQTDVNFDLYFDL